MKTLIVYYSFTHNNEKLAHHLHEMLKCDIVKIEPVRRRTGLSIMLDLVFHRKPSIKRVPYYLGNYDQVIFVAPIWAGKIATPLTSFVSKEKSNIKHYSFVTLCGGAPGQREKIKSELTSMVNIVPENVIELSINSLLPVDRRDSIKHTSGYRIESDELRKFEEVLLPFHFKQHG